MIDGGQVLAESGPIIETLLERYDPQGTLAPPAGSAARVEWRYWLHFAEGSAMPPLVMALVFSRIRDAAMPFFARPVARSIAGRAMSGFVQPQIHANAEHMDAALANRDWFAGDAFSAADIQLSFPIEAIAARADLSRYPRLEAWLHRARSRPAHARALARGGPFTLLR